MLKKELKGTKINVASVATGFPSGQSSLDVKLSDTKFAVNEGADDRYGYFKRQVFSWRI